MGGKAFPGIAALLPSEMAADLYHANAAADMFLRSEGTGRNPPSGSPRASLLVFEMGEDDDGREWGGGVQSPGGEERAHGGAGVWGGSAGAVQEGGGKKVKRKLRPKELAEAESARRQLGEGEQGPAPENSDLSVATEEEDWMPDMLPTPSRRQTPKGSIADLQMPALDSGRGMSRLSSAGSFRVSRVSSLAESFASRPTLPDLAYSLGRNLAVQSSCTRIVAFSRFGPETLSLNPKT